MAVRSGDDVFIADSCERVAGEAYPLETSLYLNGDLTPGTDISSENDGKIYKVSWGTFK